jgi:hypothetical protein
VLAPFWDHNAGYGMLGTAAFKCGEHNLAESFLVNLRDNDEYSHRSEEMGLLAEIWCRRGRREEAKQLLLDCLRKLLAERETAIGSDQQLFEDWFQNQRAAMLRLFPQDGEAILAASGIPVST